LLCDVDRTLGLAYGACKDKDAKYADRITIVIDGDGIVKKVYRNVNPLDHMDQVLTDCGGSPPPTQKMRRLFRGLFGR
jgi:peroxiredoxin